MACRLQSLLRHCTDRGHRGSGPLCRLLRHEGNGKPFRCKRCSPQSAFFRQPHRQCPPRLSGHQIVRTPTKDQPSQPHQVASPVFDRVLARHLHFQAAVWVACRSSRCGFGHAPDHRVVRRRAFQFLCRGDPTGHNRRQSDANRGHQPAAWLTRWPPPQRDWLLSNGSWRHRPVPVHSRGPENLHTQQHLCLR